MEKGGSRMKRVVTIQDISCIGKCSLTVALPIISAMGSETAVIPTAVLSAHTAFPSFTFRDLIADITDISENWKKLGMNFDAVYTGYLGSIEQLDLVVKFLNDFRRKDTLVFVDPVIGDHGKLYSGFTPQFAEQMAEKLCSHADILVPNATEASLLTGIPYRETTDRGYCEELLGKLCEMGAKKAVLTGVRKGNDIGVLSYDPETGKYFEYYNEHIDKIFHGTGDVFASCCVGALMQGHSLDEALVTSVDFVVECIRKTIADPDAPWYGVNFESALPVLLQK